MKINNCIYYKLILTFTTYSDKITGNYEQTYKNPDIDIIKQIIISQTQSQINNKFKNCLARNNKNKIYF